MPHRDDLYPPDQVSRRVPSPVGARSMVTVPMNVDSQYSYKRYDQRDIWMDPKTVAIRPKSDPPPILPSRVRHNPYVVNFVTWFLNSTAFASYVWIPMPYQTVWWKLESYVYAPLLRHPCRSDDCDPSSWLEECCSRWVE